MTLNPSPCADAPRLAAGTLSPEERRDFEEHCLGCAGCRLKVRELQIEDAKRKASERARRGSK